MGIWLDILNLTAKDGTAKALEILASELPFVLREFVASAEGSRQYKGPLPQAVARFINYLPENERAVAKSFENDLVDYILGDVITSIEKSIMLVELCHIKQGAGLTELAQSYGWDAGLKRDMAWKQQWIADMLRSMIEVNVPLSPVIVGALGNQGKAKYGFDEIAYAVAPRRLELSWKDFKYDQELDSRFLCIADLDDSTGIPAEGIDYGALTASRLVLRSPLVQDAETVLELHIIGEELSVKLTDLAENLHTMKPTDGYRPIAWHNVFWNIASEYEGLQMEIKILDPFCERDQELADYIIENYEDVVSTSRPVIVRRRQKLYHMCDEQIITHLKESFLGGAEQIDTPITHEIGEVGS